MIRGIVAYVICVVAHKLISLALRLFVLFGQRYERFEQRNVLRSLLQKRVATCESSGAGSSSSAPAVSSSAALAVSVLLGHRLSLLVNPTKTPITDRIVQYAARRVRDEAARDVCMSHLATGIAVFSSPHVHVAPRRPLVIVLVTPWETSVPRVHDICVRLANVCCAAVAQVTVPLCSPSKGNAVASDVVAELFHRITAACYHYDTDSVVLVATGFAAAFALHLAQTRTSSTPVVQGVAMIDPFVGVHLTSISSSNKRPLLPADKKSSATDCAARVNPMSLCGLKHLLSLSLSEGDVCDVVQLKSWFPPSIQNGDLDFLPPLFVAYDVDGLWVEELQEYFSGCFVEVCAYSATTSVNASENRTHFKTEFEASMSELEHWVTSLCDQCCCGRDITPVKYRMGSYRSMCSTVLSTFSRRPYTDNRHGSPSQNVSIDSMDHVFDDSCIFPTSRHQSLGAGVSATRDRAREVQVSAHFPAHQPAATSFAAAVAQPSPVIAEGCFTTTPPFWCPTPAADGLPRSASSGAQLDSLGILPKAFGSLSRFATRSATSSIEEISDSSVTDRPVTHAVAS